MTRRKLQPVPRVGDRVYVRSSYYIDRGEDDVEGGLATVAEVRDGISAGKPTPFVVLKEVPGTAYNWTILLEQQADLRKQYKGRKAHRSPDPRPEFQSPDYRLWGGK